jgi:hypothetical protein
VGAIDWRAEKWRELGRVRGTNISRFPGVDEDSGFGVEVDAFVGRTELGASPLGDFE